MNLRRGTSTPALLAACSAAAIVAAACPAKAQNCPSQSPTQTIKIFNDSNIDKAKGVWIFPVFEVGLEGPAKGNIWMQAICKIPNKDIAKFTYRRTLTNRFYINPTSGIAPGESVEITIPLFTQLVATVSPDQPNQYAEWWQGQNIQLFTSPSASPPKSYLYYYNNERGGQTELTSKASNPTWPTCTGASCELAFFSDTKGTLKKNGPSQLLEGTMGARQDLKTTDPNKPPNQLDIGDVDFDVSYVNLAYTGAAMGPYKNDQVGYVGSKLLPGPFTDIITKFLNDFPGWPRFVFNYPDRTKETIEKLPSPLEVLALLKAPNEPTELTPIPPPQDGGKWPTSVWPPIQALRDDFAKYTTAPNCMRSETGPTTFCDALLDVTTLVRANYSKYLTLFRDNICKGTPVALTPDALLDHVYSWSPWTEAVKDTGPGCDASDNLFQNTSTAYSANFNAKYQKVKLEFDSLNYNLYPNPPYVFNPWVEFIHGEKYLNMEGAYAYSVDDAVGNVQAQALGYIVDFGSVEHLENKLPAKTPILITLGGPTDPVHWATYALCSNDPSRVKPVNPLFSTLTVSANDPKNCPIYVTDNKTPPQTYTFKVLQPPEFTKFTAQEVATGVPKWSNVAPDTVSIIDCSDNTGNPPFAQSSKAWCCNLTAKNGVWAYSYPDTTSAHKLWNNYVITIPALAARNLPDVACSQGK
jgi:hypothetical protein